MPKITVIIPTAGRQQRTISLIKAIDSVLDQKDVDAVPLVVLNGNIYDSDLFSKLKSNKDILLKYIKKGSLPNAIHEGRKMVDTEFFSFLDDDDIYTTNSLALKLIAFNSDKSLDVVVGNGYKVANDGKYKVFSNGCLLNKQPLRELIKYNWLASCSALFKTNSIGFDFFDRNFKHYEWTYIAYQLTLFRKIKFINDITYIVNDTDSSLSKSEEYIITQPHLYQKLKRLSLPEEIYQQIIKKEIQCYHNISNYYLDAKKIKDAWKWHFKSLLSFYGIRYLLYTRKLI